MTVYYNEFDPFAAAWLRELIKEGVIADGVVDERSIKEVLPTDLRGFTQHHFFAGIGGWSYALRLAGWPDDKPVWTGSCPCQPFSAAGKRKGTADERHLWPEFQRLITDCEPAIVFGEQVASKDGRVWLAGVRTDLEALGYAVGSADLCAAGIGAPHVRQRLYWVADAHMPHEHERPSSGEQQIRDWRGVGNEGLGYTESERQQEQWSEYSPSGERCSGQSGLAMQIGVPEWNGRTVAIKCSDGSRRISAEPDAFPLAHGVQKRMGKLRGAGNAIIPKLGAEFIQAARESGVGSYAP